MLCTDWAARGRPADLVKGGTAISGIFDLPPLMETSINDDVRLDAEAAARNSPIHNLPSAGAGGQLIAAVGAAETPEFIAQNRAFAEALAGARGFEATVMEIEGLHHFNVVMEMGRPGSTLTQAALAPDGVVEGNSPAVRACCWSRLPHRNSLSSKKDGLAEPLP